MVHETVVNDTEDYETVEYETVVCDEMPMFPLKIVSLLHSSNSAKPLFCALQQIILYLRIGTFNKHIISICNEGFTFSV